MNTTWFTHLDRAKSTPEVVAVVRDYLTTWTPAEIALLPEQCRPARVRDAEDVAAMHATLVDAYRATRASGTELEMIQRLTSFVVRASIRLAELGEEPSGRGEPPNATGESASPREN